MKMDNEILLLCDCSSAEHQLIVSWDNDDNEVYVRIHLNRHGFWRRLWHAVKYVFGYKSRYGAFDEVILRKEDADNLQRVVDFLKPKAKEKKKDHKVWGRYKSRSRRRKLNASSAMFSSCAAIY